MKTPSFILALCPCLLALVASPVQAVVRSSTTYSTSIEALDSGGRGAGSADYTQSVTSIGLIAGVQSSAGYNGQIGYVPQTSSPAIGPAGGTLTLSPASPVDPATPLTVGFSGWSDDDLPLSYAVLIDNVVVSAQGGSAERNLTAPATPGSHTLKGRIYDALNNLTEVTQSFTINTAQETWRVYYFGTTSNSGDAADDFDFDRDGLANRLEWASGLDPTISSSLPTPTARNGSTLEFIYTRSIAAVNAGAGFNVEWSDDLPGLSWSSAGVTQTEVTNNGTLQQMKATLPAGSLGRRFVRLRVEAPPP